MWCDTRLIDIRWVDTDVTREEEVNCVRENRTVGRIIRKRREKIIVILSQVGPCTPDY